MRKIILTMQISLDGIVAGQREKLFDNNISQMNMKLNASMIYKNDVVNLQYQKI